MFRPNLNFAHIASFALILLSATANAGLFDDEEARRQVAETRRRLDDLSSQLDARLSALEATVRSKGLLDLFTQVEGIRSDISTLRGQLEVLHNDMETTQKRQRDLYVDLDTRMRKMDTVQQQQAAAMQAMQASQVAVVVPGTVLPPPAGAASVTAADGGISTIGVVPGSANAGGAAGATTPGVIVPGISTTAPVFSSPLVAARPSVAAAADAIAEQRAYDAALDQFKSGNYGASLQTFINFVKSYPKSPLAPSAQYWVGNAHYALKDYRSAIGSQRQLITTYPDSQKVPDAMLNISSSQIELGDTSGAKRTLDDLVQRYPASEAADRAKKRLPGAR